MTTLNLRFIVCMTALTLSLSSDAVRADDAAKRAQAPPALPPANTVIGVELPMPAPVPDSAKLTLKQAVQTGIKDNPQINIAHFSVVSARENYNSQKSPINPTVNYAALNNTVATADLNNFSNGANYSAYVTLETNGAIRYRTWQAREQFHQAEFDADTMRLSLKLSIIDAYVNLQVANRLLEVEQKVYDNMRKLSELTDKRFELGAGPQADAIRARIAYVQEAQNVITDVAGVNSARAALNAQLGHPTNAPVDVAEPLTYTTTRLPELDPLIALAEKKRSELLSAQANLRSLKAVPGLQRSAYYPNVIVARDFSADGEISVGLSVPLDLGMIKGSVRKAKADVKTQEGQVELERQAVDLDVKSSYINLVAARKQVETYETGILKQSEVLLNQMHDSYLLGANTILDVITAENTYRSVQSAYYSAVGAYWQAIYQMEHSIGAPLNAPPGMTLSQQAPAQPRP